MFDGSTPTPEPTPFAVGYGNGYGYESAAGAATGSAPRWGEGPATAALASVDPDATQAIAVPVAGLPATALAAPAGPPAFTARPVGAAHPRRRFGRGLVLAGLALVVTGAGIGAVALGSSTSIHPASASVSASSHPAADAAATALGDQLGRGVDPSDLAVAPSSTVPVAIPGPTTSVPSTTPAPTTPPTTAAPTTTPPTTAPPTTAPPTTAPPTTVPAGPIFTTLSVPTTVSCPTPWSDATASFSWSAPGATKVTLSIDGPGIYRTYNGPSGSETVTFPCSSSHTYLFTAYGTGNVITTESFTVTPS